MFNKKNIFATIIPILFLNFLYADTKTEDMYKQSKIFAQTISIIQNSYVEDVKSEDLIDGALNGMVGKLDEYCQILDEKTFKEIQLETSGYFGGIGIRYETTKYKVKIIEIYENTPAEKSGILKQDEIYSIDGEVLKDGLDFDKILAKIRGKIGTKIDIEIKRFNEKTKQSDLLKFKITRENIKMSTVESKLLPDNAGNIGYIKVYEFTFATKDEFDKKYKELLDKGAKYLILDLRDNPGGVFFGAIDIAKRFIGENKLIVSTHGKDGAENSQVYSADEKAGFDYLPLIVLVNKNSASSAEILAGALKDHSSGILIGEKTFGKGCVQTLFELDNRKGLRLTTAKYYTPSGECIHKKGIDPNFVVQKILKQDDKDNVLDFAIQFCKTSQIWLNSNTKKKE